MGLVEVVEVEHELSLRRSEQTEVGEMGVATELHDQSGTQLDTEAGSHDRRTTPVERERAQQHSPAPLRDPGGEAAGVRLLNHRHGIGTARCRGPVGNRGSCTGASGVSAGVPAVLDAAPSGGADQRLGRWIEGAAATGSGDELRNGSDHGVRPYAPTV